MEKKTSNTEDVSKNNKHLKNGVLQSNREAGNFILSYTPPNEENMLEGFPCYVRNSFGSLCFDHEISKVPIFTKTSNGIEVINRITMPYSSESNPNDPESGYALAYSLWFDCLNEEMEMISKREEDIQFCIVTDNNSKPSDELDYQTIVECDTIEEAKHLIHKLPSQIEARMEDLVDYTMSLLFQTDESDTQQNE